MTNLLHDYLAAQLSDRLAKSRVVVWYDPRAEFAPFVAACRRENGESSPTIDVAGTIADLAAYDGSFYALRFAAEPLAGGDDPHPVVLYLPGATPDIHGSVLMELELAGCRWEPKLRQVARYAMRQRFTDGAIDELLGRDRVTYGDLVAALATGGADGPPSLLKPLLTGSSSEAQIATWLATPALDPQIVEREATTELRRLVGVRLGLDLVGEELSKWRSITVRHVLGVEFRADIEGAVPKELEHVPSATGEVQRNAKAVARILREEHEPAYAELSDRAAAELRLDGHSLEALQLGSIDTFRFEERALLDRCARLVADGEFGQVLAICAVQQGSYWLQHAIDRQAQWEAMRLAAELGEVATAVSADIGKRPSGASAWVAAYSERWHLLDRAQRHLEAWLPKLEEDADERAVASVRHLYDATINSLAEGFVAALRDDAWSVDGPLQQTSIFDEVVRPQTGRVAYFLVDAMRFEMGAELAERLDAHGDVTLRPAVAVLPSITPTGMAALMPGAAAGYDVVERGGKLTPEVGGTALPDLRARKKHLAARIASSVDLELEEVLALNKARLAKKIGSSELVVVRSQEIDFFGEGGFQARAIMDTVIDNIARAVRRLSAVGIDRAIITADHGHLYAADDRDESLRIDAPGGATVELHRRCWVGRGGATPASCVRVAGRSLGNDSDLDFVFPVGIGVFRAGGDLAFHHGGPSMQEMIVPVVTVRSSTGALSVSGGAAIAVSDVPHEVTNRIFSVKLALASLAGDAVPVRPVLMSDDRQVGDAGMVVGGEHDRSSGTVMLPPGSDVTIGFVLDDDSAESLRIVVFDPSTDAELYRSPSPVPIRLGVS